MIVIYDIKVIVKDADAKGNDVGKQVTKKLAVRMIVMIRAKIVTL